MAGMNDTRHSARGMALVLLAAMLWGTTGTAQSLAPATLSPYWVGALRLVIGSAFFAVLAWRAPARTGAQWPLALGADGPGGGLHRRLQPELFCRRQAKRRGPGHGPCHWQWPHLGRAAADAVGAVPAARAVVAGHAGQRGRRRRHGAGPGWGAAAERHGRGAVPAGRTGLCQLHPGEQAAGAAPGPGARQSGGVCRRGAAVGAGGLGVGRAIAGGGCGLGRGAVSGAGQHRAVVSVVLQRAAPYLGHHRRDAGAGRAGDGLCAGGVGGGRAPAATGLAGTGRGDRRAVAGGVGGAARRAVHLRA